MSFILFISYYSLLSVIEKAWGETTLDLLKTMVLILPSPFAVSVNFSSHSSSPIKCVLYIWTYIIYYEKLTHAIMEAEKSHSLPSSS